MFNTDGSSNVVTQVLRLDGYCPTEAQRMQRSLYAQAQSHRREPARSRYQASTITASGANIILATVFASGAQQIAVK